MDLIIQQQQQLMEHGHLINLLRQIDDKGNFNQYLKAKEQQYLIKVYKITSLKTNNIYELHQTLQKKFYINRKSDNQEFWYQNELRIFIYLLFGYIYVNQKQMDSLKEEDWNHFSIIFNYKNSYFFEFQTLSLVKPQSRPSPWREQEISILESIINEKKNKNRWNSIARELFIRSGRRFYRNPKQCRERWMNHLDPTKVHSEWTIHQDITLLNTIKRKGKKWSAAVKQLNNTRTQHMVKNRYKSLLSNQSKRHPQKNQTDVQKIILKRLMKSQQKMGKADVKQQQINRQDMNQNSLSLVVVDIQEQQFFDKDRLPQEDESQVRSEVFVHWEQQIPPINLMEDASISISNHLQHYSESQNENLLRF